MSARAVFLDRDGVINRAFVHEGKAFAPKSLADLQILPGVSDALARLRAAGFRLVVTTNQPDVARGTTTREVVMAMHDLLMEQLPLDEVRVCFHDDADQCACRKPKPGLIVDPPLYDVSGSIMVGDRWRDIDAGKAAGCRATILVDYGYDEPIPHEPNHRVASLAEAADWIFKTL